MRNVPPSNNGFILGRLDETECKKLFLQMVQAVEACHNHGIAHRDIKLENFVMNEDRTKVYLCDFGHSALIKPGKLFTAKRGTLAYSSPEIVESKPYRGPEQDIWSLGVWYVFFFFYHFPSLLFHCKFLCHVNRPFSIFFSGRRGKN